MSHKLFAVAIIGTLFLVIHAPAQASWHLSSTGALYYVPGSVLGDDESEVENESEDNDSSESESKSESKSESESREVEVESERASPAAENQREQIKQAAEKQVETAKQQYEQAREKLKKEAEQKAKARERVLEQNKQKLELKLKSVTDPEEAKAIRLQIEEQVRNEDGTIAEVNARELEDDDSVVITRPDGTEVVVTATTLKRLEIMREKIKTSTELPITVNDANELILTKPDGTTQPLTVLPDEAVGRLQERGLLSGSVKLESSELIASPEEALYRLETTRQEKVLGLIPVALREQYSVSAATGELVGRESTFLSRLVDFFSF